MSRRRLPLFAVPAGVPFAPALANWLRKQAPAPEVLARHLLILPSRRAVTAMTEAFLAGDGALLLPRMVPVGDIEEAGALDLALAGHRGEAMLAPPMGRLARRLRLAAILEGARHAQGSRALALAGELVRVLDTLAVEQVPLTRLRDAGETLGAAHWQRNRAILALVAEAWEGIAAQSGLSDPVLRREQELALLASHWRENRPEEAVTIAGFAAAPPAVRTLMQAALDLPAGQLVLAAFDPGMREADWDALCGAEGSGRGRVALAMHPQKGIAQILEACGATPDDVRLLDGACHPAPPRLRLVAHGVAPADLPARAVAAGDGANRLRLVEAETRHEEAVAIALALREALETPRRTAALVTPDRGLARRVAGQLRRFGIEIGDSAGVPLALTTPGRMLMALVETAATEFAPVPLVSLLRNPLLTDCRDGAEAAAWRDGSIALDLVLRGTRPAPGLGGVAARIRAARDKQLESWWSAHAAPLLAPLEGLFAAGAAPLGQFMDALRGAATALAGERLWTGAEGQALAALFAEAADATIAVRARDAGAIMALMLEGASVRLPFRQHPRLAILGLLEARLQGADLLILGGLNEGSWPGTVPPDPWLAPDLRRQLGLPAAEARIGAQAQDFLALAGHAGEVLLTRAKRGEAGPEAASRFLLKLKVAAGGALAHDTRLLKLARGLDRPAEVMPAKRPAPRPPARARPNRLSASAADMLVADPFSFWASQILKVEPLELLDSDPTAADRGTAVHNILERWLGRGDDRRAAMEAELEAIGGGPAAELLWRPRVERMLDWAEEQLARDQAEGWTPVAFEKQGTIDLGGVQLSGRADRIDARDGVLRIIDYKTGGAPTKKQVEDGLALQLPALAMLAEAGAFQDVAAGKAEVLLAYAMLRGSAGTPGEMKGHRWQWNRAEAEKNLRESIGRYLVGDAPFPAKAHPLYAERYRSFDQLARLAEWFGREGGARHG
ncbi:MAG: double-strand break repair protein AddB [Thermaurantiacus sp.]